MSWADDVIETFGWVRGTLSGWGAPWGVFAAAIAIYAMLLILLAIAGHFALRGLARLTRSCARSLAVGATVDELVMLERSSARIASIINRLAFRLAQTSLDADERTTRLPHPGEEPIGSRAVRWILRRLWLFVRWSIALIAGLPRFFASASGIVIVLAATLTAFPEGVRSVGDSVGDAVSQVTWSGATSVTLATVAAAAVPVIVIVVRMLASERMSAMRGFRRQRDENALKKLYEARSGLASLAGVLSEQLHEMVRLHSIEKYHAEQWLQWAHRPAADVRGWHWSRNDHIECDSDCLEYSGAPPVEFDDSVMAARSAVEAAWTEGLRDQRGALARLITHRAWAGLVALQFCISKSGTFSPYKLPSRTMWRRRRIGWQHQQLIRGPLSDEDRNARRTVAMRSAEPPERRWMEVELRDQVWEFAELAREVSDLAEFAASLARPRRWERLAEMSA